MLGHKMPRSISIAALTTAALLGTGCFARYHWLRLWQQHRLARCQWLRLRQHHCLAHGASLHIIGCTYGGSIAQHVVPCSSFVGCAHGGSSACGTDCLARYHCNGGTARWCLARYHWLRLLRQHYVVRSAALDIIGCAYDGSSAWHKHWLRARRQHCLARGASLVIIGCAYGGSITWLGMPRS